MLAKYIIATIVSLAFSAHMQAQQLTVIGHAKGVPPNLTLNQLQGILKGDKQRWSDGTKVTIALMKTNTPAGAAIGKRILNMSGDQFNKLWLALEFQGKADAPVFFTSDADLDAFVAQTPGAIGVTGSTSPPGVKVLAVDGKKTL